MRAPARFYTGTQTAGDTCTLPNGTGYELLFCYTPAQIAAAYGLDTVHQEGLEGQGQTIVLVDSYGSPTAAGDLAHFAKTFNLPKPNFTEVYPLGKPNYSNPIGDGLSGPAAAAGWSGEATLDIEWSFATAPRAHIVLLAVPPAETEGVQGLPNLFKAITWAVDHEPDGTVFSQSFGLTEQTLEAAGPAQVKRFDAVYAWAEQTHHDTFVAAAGDSGTTGGAKQHEESASYPYPTVGWPASSPYVTAAGGTQLQYGWTWAPTSDNANDPAGYFHSTPGGETEVVWDEPIFSAAGTGGRSVLYPTPSYQSEQEAVIGANARGVPDLAWNAAIDGGVDVYITAYPSYNGPDPWTFYGGTSCASPQIAGVIALANQYRAEQGEPPVGDLNPLLYQVGDAYLAAIGNGTVKHPAAFSSTNPANVFRNIVPNTSETADVPDLAGALTSNQLWTTTSSGAIVPGPVPGYPVLNGWSMTTGFGSPRVPQFIEALASP